jgi:hypothetical protein
MSTPSQARNVADDGQDGRGAVAANNHPPQAAAPLERPARRSMLEPVMLSTVPHFLSLLFVAGCYNGTHADSLWSAYTAVVIVSSTLSLLWHGQREKKNIIFWADYAFALAWIIFDIVLPASGCQPRSRSNHRNGPVRGCNGGRQ